MRHIFLALLGLIMFCADASAQNSRITVRGDSNTVTNNQNRTFQYHYTDNRTYTTNSNNTTNSHNTGSFNDSRSNYGNTTQTTTTTTTQVVPSAPVQCYNTPCGKPPSQCCCRRQPVCPPRTVDPCPRLTFAQTQPCWDWSEICVACWDPCGKYFRERLPDGSFRQWNLAATSAPVPRGWQRMKVLRGRLYTDSNGILKFTVSWVCPESGEVVATRTFIDP